MNRQLIEQLNRGRRRHVAHPAVNGGHEIQRVAQRLQGEHVDARQRGEGPPSAPRQEMDAAVRVSSPQEAFAREDRCEEGGVQISRNSRFKKESIRMQPCESHPFDSEEARRENFSC